MRWAVARGRDCARRNLLTLALVLLGGTPCARLSAQNAQIGVALPFTFSAGMLDTCRAQYADHSAPQVFGGFRLLAMPEIKLGSHWSGYAALQVRLAPYFYQDAYDYHRQIKFDVLQGFIGYSRSWNHTALAVRAGKLSMTL